MMALRGDSGYMSNYSNSIYSQKSDNSIRDSYRDSGYDDYEEDDYGDYNARSLRSSPSTPSSPYYNDQRDENIGYYNNNNNNNNNNNSNNNNRTLNNKNSNSLYPPPLQNLNPYPYQQYQYPTSPTSFGYEYDSYQDELPSPESNKRYIPPNPPTNWYHYNLPPSPRFGVGPPIKASPQTYNRNNVQPVRPRRDASLPSISRIQHTGINPRQHSSLPNSPKIFIPQDDTLRRSPDEALRRSPDEALRRSPVEASRKSPDEIFRRIPDGKIPDDSLRRIPDDTLRRIPDGNPDDTLRRIPDGNPDDTLRRVPDGKIPDDTLRRIPDEKIPDDTLGKTQESQEPSKVTGAFDFSEASDIIDSYYIEIENSELAKPVKTPEEFTAITRKREAAMSELINTERTYIDGLKKLVNVYLLPLRENNQRSVNKILSIKPIVTCEEITALFGNIEQLLTLHQQLLKSLEESPSHRISDIFLQTAPFLKMYINYLKSFPQAIATLERLNKESKDFKKFMQQCQQKQELGGLPFNSFLSLPIQRIPRYKLLMEALLKYTDESAPDYNNLKKCVDQISIIADEVNERIRDAENQQKVLEIQGQVTGLPNNIVDPARRFIYKGNLFKATPSKIKPYYYVTSQDVRDLRTHFLFNDLLLICLDFQGIYHYKGSIDLRIATVIDIDDEYADRPYCFQLVTKDGAHTVRAKNLDEKNEWIARLKDAIWSLQNGRMTSNTDGKRLIPIRQ